MHGNIKLNFQGLDRVFGRYKPKIQGYKERGNKSSNPQQCGFVPPKIKQRSLKKLLTVIDII